MNRRTFLQHAARVIGAALASPLLAQLDLGAPPIDDFTAHMFGVLDVLTDGTYRPYMGISRGYFGPAITIDGIHYEASYNVTMPAIYPTQCAVISNVGDDDRS